jgi:hypothetical protein
MSITYRRSIVEDKAEREAVGKRFARKIAGAFAIDSGREIFFVRMVSAERAKKFCLQQFFINFTGV